MQPILIKRINKWRRIFLVLLSILFYVFTAKYLISFYFPKDAQAQTSTDANFKVAFIGDSGGGSNFQSVLNLIKAEGAQIVLHQGDFDYSAGPQQWMDMINNTLGQNFPYFGSDGNHDNWDSDGYATFFKDRMARVGLNPPSGNLSPSYSITYKGLKVVFSKENGDAAFIASQLGGDNHTWKVCSWHKNMTTMQLGGKGNEQGWGDYENCRQYGAIIATAHEHTYERTKTLLSTQNLVVDTNQHPLSGGVPGNPNSVLVAPGKTFVFVSGLGGNSIRNQDRCLPSTYPYGGGTGCNYIWASAYTSDQGAKYGALFITFNVGGNPNKATAYFKNISGQVVDQFDITASSIPVTGTQPSPTPNPTNTSAPNPTNTPQPGNTNTPFPTSPPGTSSPVYLQTVTGGSSSSTSVQSSSISGGNSILYIASIITKSYVKANSVSGLGLNWSRVKDQCAGRDQTGTDVWYALGNSSGGIVTANLASAPVNAAISITSYGNASPSSPIGSISSSNTNGVNGGCSGGTDSSSYSIPLSVSGNSIAFGVVATRASSHTPGSGFTERQEFKQGSSGGAAGLAIEDKTNSSSGNTNVNGTLSSAVDWAAVAFDIRGGGSGTIAPSSTPPQNVFGDADCDGDVDETDYFIFVSQYLTNGGTCPQRANFDSVGLVDGVDYTIWMNTYNQVAVTATPVANPSVTITSPLNGATVGSSFTLTFTTQNWQVVDGGTHVHYFIDSIDQGPWFSTSIPFSLSQGLHTLAVELAHSDHTLTGIRDTILVDVQAVQPTSTPPQGNSANFTLRFQAIPPSSGFNFAAKNVNLNLVQAGNITNTFNNISLTPNSSGIYSGMFSGFSSGTYDIFVKSSSHLQKRFAGVFLTSGSSSPNLTNLALVAGDFDNNNSLNIVDISLILSKYTQLSVPVNSTNQQFDVNSDSQINIVDVSIVLGNYTQLNIPGDSI